MLKSNWGEAIAHCLAFPEISVYVYIHLVLYLLLTTSHWQAIRYQDEIQPSKST